MDGFSPEKLLGEIFFWDDEVPLSSASAYINQSDLVQYWQKQQNTKGESVPAKESAFVQYRDVPCRTELGFGEEEISSSQSVRKRVIGFLKKSWPRPGAQRNVEEHERERCFRHMINERMRRQRQRHSCLALHSILPHGTKTDNNSVIQMAAKEIQRLQANRQELRRENAVLEESNQLVGGSNSRKLHYLRVAYPPTPKSSGSEGNGIDSMVETLKWLKGNGVDTRSIKSNFSKDELFAVFEIEESKIADAEGESGVMQTRADEIEWKLHPHVKEDFKRQRLD